MSATSLSGITPGKTYSLLDIVHRLASREECTTGERLGSGDDLAAVNHGVHVMAERGKSGEDELEVGLELILVVCKRVSSQYL